MVGRENRRGEEEKKEKGGKEENPYKMYIKEKKNMEKEV